MNYFIVFLPIIFGLILMIFVLNNQRIKKETNLKNQILQIMVENKTLKSEINNIATRNQRLVRLYQNLSEQEAQHAIRTRVLEEATQIMDAKNREIRITRDRLAEQSKELTDVHEELKNSIRYALNIQQALLPEKREVTRFFRDAFIFFQPKDIVSGDFYWFYHNTEDGKNEKILIAGDCTGHGVPGAFMTMLATSLLSEIIVNNLITRPDQILMHLDKRITMMLSNEKSSTKIHDGMDIAVIRYDESDKTIFFSSAHQPLYHLHRQKLNEIKGSKFPVGSAQFTMNKEFTLHTIKAQENDCFYIFSDGFQDQFGEKEKRKYMKRRFQNFIVSINRLPMRHQEQKVTGEFNAWKGNSTQTDDVLLIGFRV